MPSSENLLNAANLPFAEALYASYLEDPESVPSEWRAFFARESGARKQLGPSFRRHSLFNPPSPAATPRAGSTRPPGGDAQSGSNGRGSNGHAGNGHAGNGHAAAQPGEHAPMTPPRVPMELAGESDLNHPPLGSVRPQALDMAVRQDRVDQLIRAFRVRGHMIARIDPLDMPRAEHPELDPAYYKLTAEDFDRVFSSRTIYGAETLTLGQIIARLSNTYCRSIGVEFMHIHDIEAKNWLQERMEGTENRLEIDPIRQRHIYTMLTDATTLEEFIQKKFLGAKSFSLEGAESLIPLLHWTIERAAYHGVGEITLGMAHRGRLNVLANIMGKSPREIFREFEDRDPELYRGRGDVKYHMGYSSDFKTMSGRSVHLSLCFNPSHLEFVNTVVQGRVRAKQDRSGDRERERTLAVLIHGDAAFAGQGIVQETLNMSQLRAYHIGGTVHVIVNNQIGFTTPPEQARSTTYCTAVAKMLQSPIFHVNGEDPEAVAQVVTLALDFRARFRRDVVIDMYGYRRHGHNETDEPAFTQPVLYRAIQKRPSVRLGYLDNLVAGGGLTREEAEEIAIQRREHLENELSMARQGGFKPDPDWLGGYWQGYHGGAESSAEPVDTSIEPARLGQLLRSLTTVPADFEPHPKMLRLFQTRREMADGQKPLDWGAAELGALASLVVDGVPVRFTGQDVQRGTFSHRHAVVHDVNDGQAYMPMAHLSQDQAAVEIYNSCLNETGVLGFEWGYSLDCPEGLVMWEAQFGDFCNVAQVIIDQFICSAEDKWKRLSGLVMLLPHGFEGMGPEHSSARMERFLTLAAEDNIQVCQPTTPCQIFHLLRRQALRKLRKPLVVFSPKSLLRHPEATNTLNEVATGRFHRVLADTVAPEGVKRILVCTGKVYYELAKHRRELGREDVAIIRLEQLYPFPKKSLAAATEAYPAATQMLWVQDEPENMGAWRYIRLQLGKRALGRFPLSKVSREPSASPATGSASSHRLEQQELIDAAFAGL
jgi:2-oxoglutarate dehydrogenase E1 component